jgi:hypothetical protein
VNAVLEDHHEARARGIIGEDLEALFELVSKICRDSTAIRPADIDEAKRAGWTDEALYDAITVCALFQFYNTWIDATGVDDMPAMAYEASGKRIAAGGYVMKSPETK